MNANLLKKIPWKTVLKIGGAAAIGVSATLGAIETDGKVQECIKKLASKSLETMEKKS